MGLKYSRIKEIKGGICSPKGYKASGIHCGIKKAKKDLAVIYSEVPASAAGVFTTNKVKAAPVILSREKVLKGRIQGIVVNSGNANACTGKKGLEDAAVMAELAAGHLGVDPSMVAVSSTGVIGVPLPMEKISAGIKKAVEKLDESGGSDAAIAIMTTDTFPKEIAVETVIGGEKVTVAGMAKGSGMIHPDMATMLAFITTDALINPKALKKALKDSVDKSFNMITVDGDTSTNDMVLIMANGLAGNREISCDGEDFLAFKSALDFVTVGLAKMIVKDGEGATKFVEITVKNAVSIHDAKKVAKAVAGSNLVKTAVFGGDANWGRILCAAGYSGAELDPDKIDLYVGSLCLAKGGTPADYSEEEAAEIFKKKQIKITIDLNMGEFNATAWTCDLTYDYVKINGEYRT